MLDLKAKLLAAGVVTADQVKKVEDDEAQRKQRAHFGGGQQRRDQAPRAAPRPGPHGHAGDRKGADKRDDDPDEKRARREHEWNEAQRWRQRLEQLKSAGKSEQYEAVRGWVLKDRLDDKKITEAAVRFHFVKDEGAVSHLTVEPDVQQRLTDGTAGVVAFMGYNGIEHAVVPKDVADDVYAVKPDWLRHLVGVTDQAPPAGATASDATTGDAGAAGGATTATPTTSEPTAIAPTEASTS